MSTPAELQQIEEALRAHADDVLPALARRIAHLGARSEWSMEDNFTTTEWVAGLAGQVGLPAAGDQTDDALEFYCAAGGE